MKDDGEIEVSKYFVVILNLNSTMIHFFLHKMLGLALQIRPNIMIASDTVSFIPLVC